MALTQRFQFRQSQALVMTPQLMQAIKLLQLSNLDLVAFVEAELERNPLLDRGAEIEPARGRPTAAQSPDKPAGQRRGAERHGGDIRAEPATPTSDRADNRLDDTSPDDDEPPRPRRLAEAPGGYSEWAGAGSGGRDDGDYNLEAFVSAEITLADWLASS